MKPSTALYFVALIPPASIVQEVTAFKEFAAKHFDSKHALNSPPHITLIPPFRWPKDKHLELNTALTHFNFQTANLSIDLLNFSSFPPRVIFVDVSLSTRLGDLQTQLQQHFSQQLAIQARGPFGFHPHMTVAFRDLTAEVFPKAWAHFSTQNYRRSFSVEQLSLLRHTGNKWEIEANFSLQS